MSTNIPPWGYPWHGLIRGRRLELPSGIDMPMRQPSKGQYKWQASSNDLIDLGAPQITSAPSENPDIQWHNKAILSGDQLHGVPLVGDPAHSGAWIYQAPDSSVWVVSTSLDGSDGKDGSAKFTLTKFGEFYSDPESYTYTVAVPNLDYVIHEYMNNPHGNYYEVKSLRISKYCSHPKGHSAVFMVMGETYDPYESVLDYDGMAWLKASLTGHPSECQISVNGIYRGQEPANCFSWVIKGYSHYRDPPASHDVEVSYTGDPKDAVPPLCSSYSKSVSPATPTPSSDRWSDTREIKNAIISVMYDAQGGLVPVTVSVKSSMSKSWAVSASGSPYVMDASLHLVEHPYGDYCDGTTTHTDGSYNFTINQKEEATIDVEIKVGNIVAYKKSGRANSYSNYLKTGIITKNGSEERTRALSGGTSFEAGGVVSGSLDRKDTVSAGVDLQRIYWSNFGSMAAGSWISDRRYVFFNFERYSNSVLGLSVREYGHPDSEDFKTKIYADPPFTPAGPSDAPPVYYESRKNGDQSFGYASYNPITGELAGSILNLEPVNWT